MTLIVIASLAEAKAFSIGSWGVGLQEAVLAPTAVMVVLMTCYRVGTRRRRYDGRPRG